MISLCITTYKRVEFTVRSFAQVLHDERISEVIIVDDCSEDGSYQRLKDIFKYNLKVKLYRNEVNLGCAFNKRKAVELATNHWVIVLDSDNVIGTDYIDILFDYAWDEDIILMPEFAQTAFDFTAYAGVSVTKKNVSEYIDKPLFETMLNAHNLFANRKNYLEVINGEIDAVTSDSILFAHRWIESGRTIFITPHLRYWHEVHNGSHYKNNVNRTPQGLHEQILNNLRNMK